MIVISDEHVPLGCRLATPTDVEMRTWLHCSAAAVAHGYSMAGLAGPFWFCGDDAELDEAPLRGVCRRDEAGFAIALRVGLGPALRRTIFHELGHAFDSQWDEDPDGREARAHEFARAAMTWR